MSPIRSATDVSGVASFSANLRSLGSQAIGVSLPRSARIRRPSTETGRSGESLSSVPAITGSRGRASSTRRRMRRGLRLTSLPEQNDVVPGEDCPLQRRDDRVTEPDDPWEQIGTGAEALHEVVASSSLTVRSAHPESSSSPSVLGCSTDVGFTVSR